MYNENTEKPKLFYHLHVGKGYHRVHIGHDRTDTVIDLTEFGLRSSTLIQGKVIHLDHPSVGLVVRPHHDVGVSVVELLVSAFPILDLEEVG
jgi:hypothetical protein